MRPELPAEYVDKMKRLLGDDFEEYLKTFDSPRYFGLRVNLLKCPREDFADTLGKYCDIGQNVPWCGNGFYFDYNESRMPGRQALYLAGLYYIQEPSAMYPGEALDVKPGEKILDLCASPGGKSTQIASYLKGEGLLVTNDISAPRANTLLYNMELAGVRNAIVTNESPERLAEYFTGFFDKILVDAPCSGEGMFRKDQEAVKSWQTFKNEECMNMQKEILKSVDKMLKPGGTVIYSTCTFDTGENERMIKGFIDGHEGYSVIPMVKCGGIADGFTFDSDETMSACARLLPHRLKGEGHFTAGVIKSGQYDTDGICKAEKTAGVKSYQTLKEIPEALVNYHKKWMKEPPEDYIYYMIGNNLFCMPERVYNIDGLKVLRMGVHVGEINGGKLKLSQSYVMSLDKDAFLNNCDFENDSEMLKRYFKGESLIIPDALDGICGVRVKFGSGCYLVGTGDIKGGIMKNLYPKGWRRII